MRNLVSIPITATVVVQDNENNEKPERQTPRLR